MSFFKIYEHSSHLHLEFFAPQAGNALGLDVARELSRIQKKYNKWEFAVVVTSGHPTLFCSGGNLTDYKKQTSKATGIKVNREICTLLDRFGAWPVLKLAAIEGDALGGGIEWLARFDLRWSSPSVLLSFWQKRMGLSPGWGGGKAWAKIIGEEKLRVLLNEARLMTAESALRLGLIDRVICPWKIRAEIGEWAARLRPPLKPLAKWTVRRESTIFSSLWHGPEHKAALKKWKG